MNQDPGETFSVSARIRRSNAELDLPLAQEHLLEVARVSEARARQLAKMLAAVEAATNPGHSPIAARIATDLAQAIRGVDDLCRDP